MDNETKTVNKYIADLPQTLRDYLLKRIWIQKALSIAGTNKLTEDQATALKGEVFLVLIGMENYSDFTKNIQKNVTGLDEQTIRNIVASTERNIFFEIKPYLLDIEKANNEAGKTEIDNEESLSKDRVLDGIENPIPTRPRAQNPAGNNPILDAQHNLPEQEKKILISSAAVPSRGPILGNLRTQPFPQPPKPIQPTASPIQPPKPPQAPMPPAPDKYTIDPYRELNE